MLTENSKKIIEEIYQKTMEKLELLHTKQKEIISKTLKKLEERRIEEIRNKLKQ